MKKKLIALAIIGLLCMSESKAQDSVASGGNRFYRISLSLIPKHMKNKSLGYLVWLTDSTLYYSDEKMPFSPFDLNEFPGEKISFRDMKTATLYTVNPTATVLLPAVAGMVTGGVIGFAAGDDPPGAFLGTTAGEKALILGSAGFAAGAIIGGILVAIQHHVYNIKGRQEKFLELIKFVKDRELRKNK